MYLCLYCLGELRQSLVSRIPRKGCIYKCCLSVRQFPCCLPGLWQISLLKKLWCLGNFLTEHVTSFIIALDILFKLKNNCLWEVHAFSQFKFSIPIFSIHSQSSDLNWSLSIVLFIYILFVGRKSSFDKDGLFHCVQIKFNCPISSSSVGMQRQSSTLPGRNKGSGGWNQP